MVSMDILKILRKIASICQVTMVSMDILKIMRKIASICHKSYTCLPKMLLKNQYENIENKLGTLQGILLNL